MQPGCLALFGTLAALGSEWHPRVLRLEVNGVTNGLFTPAPAAHWGTAEDVGTTVLGLLNVHLSDCAYGWVTKFSPGWWEWGLCIWGGQCFCGFTTQHLLTSLHQTWNRWQCSERGRFCEQQLGKREPGEAVVGKWDMVWAQLSSFVREPSPRGGGRQMYAQSCGNPPFSHWSKHWWLQAFNNLLCLSFCTVGQLHIQDLGRVYCKTLVQGILESRTWKISLIKNIQMQIQALSSALHHTLLLAAVHLSEQAQQQANNFMYRSRTCWVQRSWEYICKCLQDQDPMYCMEFGLAFCFSLGFDLLFLNTTVIDAF